MANMFASDHKILSVLEELSPTLSWLNDVQPVPKEEVPDEHMEALKQLERIGIVHRQNSRTYLLKMQRLKRLLAAESRSMPFNVTVADFIGNNASQARPGGASTVVDSCPEG